MTTFTYVEPNGELLTVEAETREDAVDKMKAELQKKRQSNPDTNVRSEEEDNDLIEKNLQEAKA